MWGERVSAADYGPVSAQEEIEAALDAFLGAKRFDYQALKIHAAALPLLWREA
jgi:hypothetical protein